MSEVQSDIPSASFSPKSVTESDEDGEFCEPEFEDVGCGQLYGLTRDEFEACKTIDELHRATGGKITSWTARHFADEDGDYFYDCHCIVCDVTYQFGEELRCHSCDAYLEEDELEEDFCRACLAIYGTFCDFCHKPLVGGRCVSEGV